MRTASNSLRVVTYNLWHGYRPKAGLVFEPLETSLKRKLRLDYQVELLKSTSADILFLQEVSPCAERSQSLAHALGLSEVHCSMMMGIKCFGFGIPINLNFGLTILARKELKLKLVSRLHLSGDRFGFVTDYASFQLSEWRSALIAKIEDTKGRETYLVNTHLHHRLGLSSSLKTNIQVTPRFEAALRLASSRRRSELSRLFGDLDQRGIFSDSHPIILAGDFNMSSDTEEASFVRKKGFKDAAQSLGSEPITWDGVRNPLCRMSTEEELSELKGFQLEELDPFVRTRRLDYVFCSQGFPYTPVSYELVGTEPLACGEVWASDHYGLQIDFSP